MATKQSTAGQIGLTSIDVNDPPGEESSQEGREHHIHLQGLQKSDPPVLPITLLFRKHRGQELDQIATQPSVIDDPACAQFFQPTERYENIHRFDPTFMWTWREELSLINKIDWRITLWACIAFFALELDRGNISQANTDNFLEDLNLTTNDFNLGNTIFALAFLLAELPSQLASKRLGPDRWIPTTMCLWSTVAASQFWLSGRASFLFCRALLGLLQGGFIPDVILYLSYFFKSSELSFRLALFWATLQITDIVAPILALCVLRLRGLHGHEGWRWLFLVEGLLTLTIGFWSFFSMAPGPTQTRAWFRPRGWFNEHEEKIMVNRVLRDDPSKGDMHNRQAVDLKLLWKSICDYDLWPLYILGLTFEIPSSPLFTYFTLTLRNLGFDTFDANLLTIPMQVCGAITMLVLTYLSEILNERALLGLFAQVWILPNIVALTVLPSNTSPWVKFAVVTVLLSFPSPHAIQAGWCSKNSNSVRARTVSAALYNMFVQASFIISANIYRQDDRPDYRRGNRQLTAICAANVVIYSLVKIYYVWRNKMRGNEWANMSVDQRLHYLETTTDTGSRRRDFRFAH